jgi:putative FmdB family regulatory protein
MPIYEFHCAECERDSEILVRSTDWKTSECPHCGSKRLAKKFSTFAAAGGGSETSSGPTVTRSPRGGGGCCGGGCHGH